MPSAPTLVVIGNPAAGGGAGRRALARVQRALASHEGHAVRETTSGAHARALARAAAEGGAGTVLAVGGDGTVSAVAHGLLEGGGGPRLAVAATGTGNDLAFSAGLPSHDVARAVAIALGGASRAIDVGEIDGIPFVNVAGVGFDATVGRRRLAMRMGGRASYAVAAVRELFGYRGLHARVQGDAPVEGGEARHLAILFANGRRFGGGFLVAPGAALDDGLLDMVRIADAGALRRLRLFLASTRGRHVGAPEVRVDRVTEVTLAFREPPLLEVDGELHLARGPLVTIRVRRSALRLAVPP